MLSAFYLVVSEQKKQRRSDHQVDQYQEAEEKEDATFLVRFHVLFQLLAVYTSDTVPVDKRAE